VKIENIERRDKRGVAINDSGAICDWMQLAAERNKKRGAWNCAAFAAFVFVEELRLSESN